MNFDTILDYAQFQLSPRRTRCELFISGGGRSEKLASGYLKPFLTHLKVAEEQANQAVPSIKLEVEKRKNAGTWFNKGTIERFVRFVSTPEVLELVNTFDTELSQLEGARKIYFQGAGDQLSSKPGENESAAAAAADITKPKKGNFPVLPTKLLKALFFYFSGKELLKAIDVRVTAVKQDLATACARASAAGFTLESVSELLLFAERFGALRLNEACTKFISQCQRRPELITHQQSPPPLLQPQWKGFADANVRSSSSSDMSIDEPEVEPSGPFRPSISGTSGTGPETHKPTSGQLPQKSAAEIQLSAHSLVEKVTSKAKEGPSPSVASSAEPVQAAAGGSRRLSVQDRINLFESKQKEQSASASIASSSSGGGGTNRVVAGKGEHRRLPSDVSMEKSVLRRWSGASDMSIDLTNNGFSSDRKESESVAVTPTSSANSHVQSGGKTEEGAGVMKDTASSWPFSGPKENSTVMSSSSSFSSFQAQTRSFTKDKDQSDYVLPREEGTARTYQAHSGPTLEKRQRDPHAQFGTSVGRAHQSGFSEETDTHASSKPPSDSGEGAKLKDNTTSLDQFNGIAVQNVRMKDQAPSLISSRAVPTSLLKAEPKDQAGEDTAGVGGPAPSMTKFGSFAGKIGDGGAKLNVRLDSQFQSKSSLGKVEDIAPQSDLPSQSQRKPYPRNKEGGRKDDATISHVSFKVSVEDSSGSQGMKLHGRTNTADQMKKVQGRRDEKVPNQGTNILASSVKKAKEPEEVLQLPSAPPAEQALVARPLKANAELQMKADELEKLFAAHKLRVHGDQTASTRRSKTIDDQAVKYVDKLPTEVLPDQFSERNIPTEILSNRVEFDANLLLKMVDNLDSANSMKQKLGTVSPSDDSRGKLYEKYMQKRDAKLMEEWGSKRAQKEAKMKAMHDSLEHSQAEMKAKLAGSADKRDSVLAHRRAEKMRPFNVRIAIKNQGQKIDHLQEEGEDLQELDKVLCGQEKSFSDTLSDNESSTSSKKFVSSKSLSSSAPRTSAAPIPKPSAKATNSGSMRCRTQPENPLAQSVPSFSDLRKENTKHVTGLSKGTSHSQPRTFARNRSATEEATLVKEEKSQRSHSMRKSLAIPGELKDPSPFTSDGANMIPLNFSKDQMEQCVIKIQNSELKPFLRKGNGRGAGAGAVLAKLKASTNPEALKDEKDSEGLMDQQEDSPDIVKDDEEEFDRASAEGNLQTMDVPADLDSEDDNRGSENGDVLRSQSQDVEDSIAVSSKFNPSAGNVQESPGESAGSWNSNIHHSFSYAHEASDIDASVDSPIGSPVSWSSHPLNQMMEADAARMRKKWGSAQIPVLNAPHQPRKDVTKGFKRLLKFGRKSRGAEYLVNDWVSASRASEGDDDPEDSRELGSRTSDELRKSRMGYPVPAYDGFNDGDSFPEQVQSLRSSIPNAPANFKLRENHLSGSSIKAPRSFFSLSSFRSKGSEAKPR